MNRPYIICHMMSSVDGRIDCAMTEKLPGVEEYYSTLGELNAATTLSGKTTAKLELAESGEFKPSSAEKLCKEAFSKKADARGYEVITVTYFYGHCFQGGKNFAPLPALLRFMVSKGAFTIIFTPNSVNLREVRVQGF